MSKTKMRCITCGKWFQSANAKELTCPDCTQKARREKQAAKTMQVSPNKSSGQGAPVTATGTRPNIPPPKPKSSASGTNQWFDNLSDVKVAQPDQPTRPKIPSSPSPRPHRGEPEREREGANRGPGGYRENDYRSPGGYRAPYRVGGGMGLPETNTPTQRPRQPMKGGQKEGYPGGKKGGKPPAQKPKAPPKPPKPKKEKIPPPPPFMPTAEQVAQVEARYLELSVPTEHDGVRTEIAKELGLPKKAVKKIVKDLREREGIPSWWDLQTYSGTEEELEKIKAAYLPLLPIPPIGVHKKLAEELELKPGSVYQAIKKIRLDMQLPQYNDPALHGSDLHSIEKTETPEDAKGDFVSIETDTIFEKVDGSTEIVPANAGEENKPDEV